MTDQDYRHYVLITDRSGSMLEIQAEAQNGIRFFLKEQAELPGKATLTLVQFDDRYEVVHDFAPLEAAASYELVPRNMTALLDACGNAVTSVGERLAAMPEDERPGRVIVLITTDGKENASREWTRRRVRELVEQQRDYGWQFSYIGANVDAFEEAGALGIPKMSSMNFSYDSHGTQAAFGSASSAAIRYARGQSAGIAFTDEERKEAGGGV